LIGRTISHYKVLAEISRGGMGIVYRAVDLKLNREVALKVLPPELVADRGRKARFVQEARAAAAVEHPHIAVVYEIDDVDGVDFIAMELIHGEKLSDVLARGKLSPDRAVELGIEISEGLARAHDRSIIHRDLKPANVMVTVDGHVKIIDFGLAKLTEREGEAASELETARRNQTSSGVVLGTVSYMSPEQAKGERIDHRTDIFSFGILLYEMLVGALPFQGPSAPDVLHAIIHQPAPRLPGSLSELQRILDGCLAKESAKRFERMGQLLKELREARERPRRSSRRLAPWLAAGAAAASIFVGIFAVRSSRVRWAREDALPEVARLASQDQYAAAFLLAQRAKRYLGDDPTLRDQWERISRRVSIRTEPPDADVFYRPFPQGEGADQHLGTTPVEDARIPMGSYWLRIEKTGYLKIESLVAEWLPELVVELQPIEGVPPGMVHIPKGRLGVGLAGFDRVVPLESPGYWIDEDEVTNRQFKEFVDAGGYGNRDYWEHPVDKARIVLTFEQSRAEFRDRTGRPGPSTWEGGTYPGGRDDYPVSGVSWYEAAAYAKFKGRSLPTIYHWTRGTHTALADAIFTFSNFGGEGPEPVASRPRGPYGTRHMAGNVKEWCWNESEGFRYILGGAWNEPPYQFYEVDLRSPLDRSPQNGFRTALYPDASDANLESMRRPIPRPARRAGDVEPVVDEVFEAYKAQFEYDPKPLDAIVEAVDDSSQYWKKEKVTFSAAYGGEHVIAYLFLPKNVAPPFQTILVFPGSDGVQIGTSEDLDVRDFGFVVMSGRAVLYPVVKGTYERRDSRLEYTDANPSRTYAEFVGQWVKDVRRSLDYLESRPDIDSERIGFYGVSWGARIGNVVLAVEERFRVAVLMGGGLPHVQPLPEVAETNYASRVRIPVLMLNGAYDRVFPFETNQKPMFELLGSEEKEHVVFESGHVLVGHRNQMIQRLLDWLDRNLGPVS
jgi:dienelactone hydrolase/predicted Ser/Thr protein kinase